MGAALVLLKPASPGTGIVAGGAVRAVMEVAGVKNVLTKSLRSMNAINVVRATMDGLSRLRTRRDLALLRNVGVTEANAGAATSDTGEIRDNVD